MFYRCLRLNAETLFWDDLPGSYTDDQQAAIHTAKIYFEHSGKPVRAIAERGAILWDSFRDLPRAPVNTNK